LHRQLKKKEDKGFQQQLHRRSPLRCYYCICFVSLLYHIIIEKLLEIVNA